MTIATLTVAGPCRWKLHVQGRGGSVIRRDNLSAAIDRASVIVMEDGYADPVWDEVRPGQWVFAH